MTYSSWLHFFNPGELGGERVKFVLDIHESALAMLPDSNSVTNVILDIQLLI